MNKQLTKTQIAFIKRINSSVKPYQHRIDALNKKKESLDIKISENQEWIDKMENTVKEMTEGMTSTQFLINCEIVGELNTPIGQDNTLEECPEPITAKELDPNAQIVKY